MRTKNSLFEAGNYGGDVLVNSRAKGARGERELAEILRCYGFSARRGQQYRGGADSPDVMGLPGIHIEVKRVERLNIYDARPSGSA